MAEDFEVSEPWSGFVKFDRPAGRNPGEIALMMFRCGFWLGVWILALAGGSRTVMAMSTGSGETHDRPNILWIIVDDMSADFGCYGSPEVNTPHVDGLARRGLRFEKAFVTAPVCSPCRSALITGMYQTSIGAHHHRSGRGELKIQLPPGIRPIPALFQDAGYYTCCCNWPLRANRPGKTDYNFAWDRKIYDGGDWRERPAGQPFFAQVQLPGGKLRGGTQASADRLARRAVRELGSASPADSVRLPPWYPDHPVLRQDRAAYLDSVRFTDLAVGRIIDQLRSDGDLGNTVVFFMTDHGISHARAKQFLYDEGIHVPLVIAGPSIPVGTRDDLVEHIDLAATSLALGGIPVPADMQSRDLLAHDYQPRSAVYAARDRCDETVDRIRCLRTDRYKYIRNGYPQRPWLQPNAYKDNKSVLRTLRVLHREGGLSAAQAMLLTGPRPVEELYDLQADPGELDNLADDPAHRVTLADLRQRLDQWVRETGDQGQQPEPDAMYQSDMDVYLGGLQSAKQPNRQRIEEIRENILLMQQWQQSGK